MVECCFTSTETVGLLGTGAQDVHLDFRTAPELLFVENSYFYNCLLSKEEGGEVRSVSGLLHKKDGGEVRSISGRHHKKDGGEVRSVSANRKDDRKISSVLVLFVEKS